MESGRRGPAQLTARIATLSVLCGLARNFRRLTCSRLRRLMTTAPLTFRSWLTLFTSFVILTVAFAFGLFCWPAVYRPLVKAFGWNFASANAGGAIALLMIGILSPFVGTLVDRFRPKPVILGGTLIVAAALALLS